MTTSFHNHTRLGDIPGVYEALADSLNYYLINFEERLFAYSFMPTHLHLLLGTTSIMLGPFMRDFKKYLSQKALKDLHIAQNPIWQLGFDRVAVESEDVFWTKLNYIHNNPVKAGLVEKAEDWKWSSAGTYCGKGQGLVSVLTEWHW